MDEMVLLLKSELQLECKFIKIKYYKLETE